MAIQNGTEIQYEGRVYSVLGKTLNDMFVDQVKVIEDNGHLATIILGQEPNDQRTAKVDATSKWLEKARMYQEQREVDRLAHYAQGTGLSPEQFTDVERALTPHQVSRSDISLRLRNFQQGLSHNKFQYSLANQVIAWAKTDPSDRKYSTPLSAKQTMYFS